MTATVALPVRIGARTILRVRRRVIRVRLTLEEVRAGHLPVLASLPADCHGYYVLSLPADLLDLLLSSRPGLTPFVRQRYRRRFASLAGSFDDYLAGFSPKSRSTMKRKVRKLTEASGGDLDVRTFRLPSEIREFYCHARAVSSKTYQERLLDRGLPQGDLFVTEMMDLACRDSMRGWVLFLAGAPISYLYAFAEERTLIYAYLGYDPAFAKWSPGSVLQFEAMRRLFAEQRFDLFDFTEGEGQHKRLFGTGAFECVDLLLLRPTLVNFAAGYLVNGTDAGVALAKRIIVALGLERLVRTIIR